MVHARFAAMFALLVSVGAAASPPPTQKSVENGVTVAVTPGHLEEDARVWDFAVVFDGSGRRFDERVLECFELVGDGRRIQPLEWEGQGAAVGHRAGVLKFAPMQPRPKELELRFTRRGEAKPRVFRFAFGHWSA